MSRTRRNANSAEFQKRFRAFHQSARSIDHVVHNQTVTAPYIANHIHYFRDVGVFAALIDNRQGCIQPFCD